MLMLLDTLTLAAIIKARNTIAAHQFLGELLHRTPDNVHPTRSKHPVLEYQKLVLTNACILAGNPSAQVWLQSIYA